MRFVSLNAFKQSKWKKNIKFKRIDLDEVDFFDYMNEILSDLEMWLSIDLNLFDFN